LIEGGPGGTTCARVGCMPSKALIAAAEAVHGAAWLHRRGLAGPAADADGAAILERVRALRDDFAAGPAGMLEGLGEDAIRQPARFREPGVLELAEGEAVRAEAVILATGSTPVVPASWPALGDHLLTTDTLFEQTALPHRLAVAGLGPIGLELGQALARLGVEVVGFQAGNRLGGIEDEAVSEAARTAVAEEMAVHLETPAEPAPAANGVMVNGERFDALLAALGRRPRLAGLGLENLGLDPASPLPVDPGTLQVADLPVWAAGDVAGLHPLQHEAADEGRLAAHHALASGTDAGRRVPLAIVFSEPQLARVGPPPSALPAGTVTGRVELAGQGRARMNDRDAGAIALHADPESGRLLGAELAAPAGEHLAHLLAWALGTGLTVDDALALPFYHPTLEESLRSALQAVRRAAGHRRRGLDLPER
ncbi:dihydrolipoyl dehydrogenase, partial [Thiohalospira sp.]|uniref:dihydrolipoyl dehydrogenase n=1 Tax=Thiohalospira sp. TaxID=3080549 RepID=UPI0039814296